MHPIKHWVVAIIIAGLYFWIAPSPVDEELETGRVRYVVDGDTFILDKSEIRIRLWGVDADERNEPGYAKAKNVLKDLVQGKPISYLVKDVDKYYRIVARVFLENETEVNRYLIEGNFTKEYCLFSKGFYGYC